MINRNSDVLSNNQSLLPSLKNQHILQVLPSLVQGGVERGTLEMAQAIQQAHGKAWIASTSGPLVGKIHQMKAQHVDLPLKTKNPFKILFNIYRLYRLVRQEKINLIHVRSRAPAWSAFWAARLAHIPFVTTFHGSYNFKFFFKKYYNSIMVRGDCVIAVSNYIYNHILENYGDYVKADRLRLIPRGVDLETFDAHRPDLMNRVQTLRQIWQISSNTRVILLVGRLTRWKGHETALKALALLNNFQGKFVCLGADQGRKIYSDSLKSMAKAFGLAECVCFVSTCEDMPAAYAMADLVLHTSTDPEAFGRTIIEAQAMGKCVIATAHGAPVDIIQDKVTGYLVPPQDPQQLAHSIQHYFSQTARDKEALSLSAIKRVHQLFSHHQMVEKTLKVYQELLTQKSVTKVFQSPYTQKPAEQPFRS